MDSVPDSTVRAVARKLRHYIDVERREDGFDRSGPMNPLGEFTSTRGGTLYYNSLQDKHLQHYFRKPMVRKRLEELGVTRRQKRRRSLESGIQNLTGVPAQASGRCQSSRLVNTTAKILTETGSALSAYTPKNHGRKLSAHGSYSSFASEVSPDQQSLTSKSGHSIPSQTARKRSTTPSDQALVSPMPTSPPGSSRTPGGKREEASSAQQYPQGRLPSYSLTYPPSSPSILEPRQVNVHSHTNGFVPTELQVSAHQSRQCVHVVNVGVSTATSCDASTQTLVHAETQTEKSMLAGVRFGKDKRSKKRRKGTSGSKVDREVVLSASHQDSIPLKATTQMKSEGGSTVLQRQRVESVDETTPQGDTADPLQIETYNETRSSVEPQRQRVGSQDERAPEESSAEHLRVESRGDNTLERDLAELQGHVQTVESQDENAPEEGSTEHLSLRVEIHSDTASQGNSAEPQRLRVRSQDGTVSEEEPQKQRVGSQDGTVSEEEPQKQRVGSQDGTVSEEEPQKQRVGSQDGTVSEEESQRQRVGSQDGTVSEERQRVGSQDGIVSQEEPQRQRVGSQDGTVSEEEPQRRRVGSQDGTVSEEEPQRRRVGSQGGAVSEEEPQRRRVGSQGGAVSEEEPQRRRVGSQGGAVSEEPKKQRAGSEDGTVSEGGQNEASSEAENEMIQDHREVAVQTYVIEAVDPADVDRLKELISQDSAALLERPPNGTESCRMEREGGSHSAAGLLPPEQDDEHLEVKWTSDSEQGTRSQSSEKQGQQEQEESEMQEMSSTFLDLAREEVENEGLGSSHENDTGSV